MRVLVTGSAGFIGAGVTQQLLMLNHDVIGIDNLNDYYDQKLKQDRLSLFINHPKYTHRMLDISNVDGVDRVFNDTHPEIVINLAAQAGVRYSIENPQSYVSSNLVGYANLIECARSYRVSHFIYASSSSVYGANKILPYGVDQCTERPLSLYAATKKANELIAYSYSHIFNMKTTGLRFFTVYGPWGRPDMAIYKFTKAILNGDVIELYNYGSHLRDLTYIDDVVEAITQVVMDKPLHRVECEIKKDMYDSDRAKEHYRIYNVGSNNPVKLTEIVECLEQILGRAAHKRLVSSQLGDVHETHADISQLTSDFGYAPKISMYEGLSRFTAWYLNYYSK